MRTEDLASIESNQKRLGRVLSVDPRSRRIAYAYFHDGALKDCRLRNIRQDRPSVRVRLHIIPYLVALLDECDPHALLIPDVRSAGARRRGSHATQAIKTLAREALARGIAVHVVRSDDVKKFFRQADGTPVKNRDEIHALLVERFPELKTMVPSPRGKLWETERHNTPLFNAVAMYLAWQSKPTIPNVA